MTSKYTYQRRNEFSNMDWSAFGDIKYLWWDYKGKKYYYCVAYVWDNTWMRWYPYWVSPICNWKFCGARTTTLWEFLQVVLNIADQYVYQKYLVKWSDVKSWMDSLQKWSYADTYLTNSEKDMINSYANNKISGELPNEESLQPYIKYCMFNLDKCGMQKFWVIWQWYWPVWELNILYDNNIVEYAKYADWDIHELVDWKFVLETLYNLFNLIDCDFNYDYDCDWLINTQDNCPNAYNPHQTDTDGDWIWDVCDDDIDWDWVKNPIWIVDDLWSVVISKYEKWMDNCLFVVNANQLDSSKNWVWDACENDKMKLWMYIKTSSIKSTAPVSVEFQAITQWSVKWKITRTFGDWTSAEWKKVSHKFEKDWLYTVQAIAEWYSNNAQASTTIMIWKDPETNYWLQIIPDKQVTKLWWEINFKINKNWDFDSFQWDFGNWNVVERKNGWSISRIFKNEWTSFVTLKWFKDWKIVAVANSVVWVWNSWIWSSLQASNVHPKKWESISLRTSVSWFTTNDISSIERNMWDETYNNNNLNWVYSYKLAWSYVIVQTINLVNWNKLQNFLTINVWDSALDKSYAIETDLDKTIINSLWNINFSTKQISSIPVPTLILNSYDDWSSEKTYENLSVRPKSFDHKYYTEWIYFPKTTVFIDDCVSLSTVATVVVNDWDICLDALLNGTLNQLWWDLDKDWIPDICDDDIDWDWFPNLIWAIRNSDKNSNFNVNNVNWEILSLHKNICSLDNCPTKKNINQIDLNNNGRWDECDWDDIYSQNISNSNLFYDDYNNKIFGSTDRNDNDTDWDWITNDKDICPELPENYNWVLDFDWCPEIWVDKNCSLTNYNYVNNNWSVYPVNNLEAPERLSIIDPKKPEPSCVWDTCKTICVWDVSTCTSCNWDKSCELCLQNPDLCGSWSGGDWPFSITARCQPEHELYTRYWITSNSFSFSNMFEWTCPCKPCHWFVSDANWLISSIWDFSVCAKECIDDYNIQIHNPNSSVPACKWKDCNWVACNWDITCDYCKKYPELCWSWSGGIWPYTLFVLNESGVIYSKTWINSHDFSFADMLEWDCPCKTYYWYIIDSNWKKSSMWKFLVCDKDCESTGIIDSTGIIMNDWPNDSVTPCVGNACNNICQWDINNCPSCNWSKTCENCEQDPDSCGTWTWWEWPFVITSRCEDENILYQWFNITSRNFSFNNIFEWDCPCRVCHRFVSSSDWLVSGIKDIYICNNCTPDSPWIISEWPDVPVTPCVWNECDNVCQWDVNDCPSCNWSPDCDWCEQNPDSCGTWTWWEWPFIITARCESNSIIYQRFNITSLEFSFANIFEWDCPCRVCHRFVEDELWNVSETNDIFVCNEECNNPTDPDVPTIIPGDEPIETPECLSCPCIFTDYWDTLNINDKVKAILFDYDMSVIYWETIPVSIMQYLN